MYLNRKVVVSLLSAGLASIALASQIASAAETREMKGYVGDTGNNVVTSGSGDCVHTGFWDKADATLVGCDGYTLDTSIKVIEGEGLDTVSTITFPQAELFAFDSAELSDSGKEYISNYADELGDALTQAYSVTVIGYTDSTGDAKYNQGLSERRAKAVADYIDTLAVPSNKNVVRTLGRGESDPIASNDTPEGRAENRRVEVVVVGQPRALDAMIFPAVALFERRSAEISGSGDALMKQSIEDAKEVLKRSVYIEVVGHTDDVGDDDYNMKLSEQRAEAVRTYLVNAGVDESKIVSWGAGETMPAANNATEEGRAENRRVEVLVLGRTYK